MALNRGNLGFVTQVGAGLTAAVYTVGSAQTAYIKSILFHNLSSTLTQNISVYMVQNSGGSPGTASTTNRIAQIGISTNDTFFFEPAYPITLSSTGDSLQVYNQGVSTNDVNVVVLGDKEV